MILLDTHIFLWWIDGSKKLSKDHLAIIRKHEPDQIGLSIISCWEIAKLSQLKRLELRGGVEDWLEKAISFSNVRLLNLDVPIVLESTQLPGNFHRDPADQLIVATSRILKIPLLTSDEKIQEYPHVKFAG